MSIVQQLPCTSALYMGQLWWLVLGLVLFWFLTIF